MNHASKRRGDAAAGVALLLWAVVVVVSVAVAMTLAITGEAVNWWTLATVISGSFALLLVAAIMSGRKRRPRAHNLTDHPITNTHTILDSKETK